jgi:hypothetical protein
MQLLKWIPILRHDHHQQQKTTEHCRVCLFGAESDEFFDEGFHEAGILCFNIKLLE